MKPSTIQLSSIRIDGGTQPRGKIDEAIVAEYANAMRDGATFPPVVVFIDGVDTWLADGFHRFHAVRKNQGIEIVADVRTGTKRDAILFSVGANAAHGARRTNEDKSRAVDTLLNDSEWSAWTNCEIARKCCVDESSVRRHREKHTSAKPKNESQSRTFTHAKTGKPAQMKTENIGKKHRKGHAGARADHIERIAELASQGNNSDQIAAELGIDKKTVRLYANQAAIVLPDHITGKVHRVDNRRVLEETVLGLEASAASLRTLGVSLTGISPEDAADWAKSMTTSIRALNALCKKLKEHANGKA